MVFTSLIVFVSLLYAEALPTYAQGTPKTGCIDPGEYRRRQALERDTLDNVNRQAAAYQGYITLAVLCETEHRFGNAEQYYQSARTLAKGAFGERSDSVLRAVAGIGSMRLEQGRIRDADVSYHEALSILESDKNANPLHIASVLNNMAILQQMTGNFSKAAALMRKVVHMIETEPAAEPKELGGALSNLGAMLRYLGDRQEAVAVAERAGAILECCRDSQYFTANLLTRSVLRLDEGNLSGAETMLLRALGTMDGPDKQDSPTHAIILTHLGALYTRDGRHAEAEKCLQHSLEIGRRLLTPDHPRLLESMYAYALLLRATKRKGEAKKLEAYIEEHRKNYSAQNPTMTNVVDVHSLRIQGGH
jgi:tetratricopeptide (TPR) repeat protein